MKCNENVENDHCLTYVSDMVSRQWVQLVMPVLGRGKAMPVTLADIRTRSILSPYLSVHISFGFLLPLLATKNSYLFFYFFLIFLF